MREEPALTRDNNVRAGPEVTGAVAAIGAASPGAAAALVAAATGAAGRGAGAAAGSGVGTIGPGGGRRLVGAVVDCCWGAVGRTKGHA